MGETLTAIAMLNHLTVLTQETNDSKNSRLFMEQAYSELINNTYPNSVDDRTLSRLLRLLDTMENYRMVNIKRERLQYIYEQNQAQAIRSAIPNPLGMLSTAQALTPARLVASIAYMAVDAVSSYESAKSAADLQYLRDRWQLDDEEAKELHESQMDMFAHIIKIVNDYKFDGDLALNEESVTEFSRWKNDENVVARIQFLESNKKTYQAYGGYWLTLAESYYAIGEFSKCLDAIKTYEGMAARIYRRDFEYARTLPLAIAASEQIQTTDEYEENGSRWAEAIVNNTRNEDWALRYFAAQTYISIYDKTGKRDYLKLAYDIAVNNATNLLQEQRELNKAYLSPVQEVAIPKDATNEQKDEINKNNTLLKEKRKTELAPASESMILNCDLLFDLADLIGIDDAEKARIDAILHPNKARLFVCETLDRKYWFNPEQETSINNVGLVFNGTRMIIPAMFYSENTTVSVSVKEKDAEEPIEINDWRIDKVERGEEEKPETYAVFLVSDKARMHTWGPESEIIISTSDGYTFTYTTQNVNKQWFPYDP